MTTDAAEALSKLAPMTPREASRIYAATKELPVGFELISVDGKSASKILHEVGELGDRWWWKTLRADDWDIICRKQ